MTWFVRLASRNLFQDRLRCRHGRRDRLLHRSRHRPDGLFLSFERMVTTMIDHAARRPLDRARRNKCFEDPSLLDERERPGVVGQRGYGGDPGRDRICLARAEWRRPTPVFIVGGRQRPTDCTLERGRRQSRRALDARRRRDRPDVFRAARDRRGSATAPRFAIKRRGWSRSPTASARSRRRLCLHVARPGAGLYGRRSPNKANYFSCAPRADADAARFAASLPPGCPSRGADTR